MTTYESRLIQVPDASLVDALVDNIGQASADGFVFKSVIRIPRKIGAIADRVGEMIVFEDWLLYERPAPEPEEPEEELPELDQTDIAYWISGFDLQRKGKNMSDYPAAKYLDEGMLEAMANGWVYAERHPDKPIPKQYRQDD